MQRIETSLRGVFELRPQIFRDQRGFFLETYHQARYVELGIKISLFRTITPVPLKGRCAAFTTS